MTISHPTKTETTMKKDEMAVMKTVINTERDDWKHHTAEYIKKARLKMGLTQSEFGERFGVKKNTVSRWESGKREAPYTVFWTFLIELGMLRDYNDDTSLRQSLVKEVEGKHKDMLSGIKRTADKMLREKNITHEVWERLIAVIGYYKKLSILQEKE